MAIKFNPLTGNFDFTGSGGGGGGASYIDGEVAVYTDLSLDAGVAPLNTAWLVREASGAWLLARKPAGIYIRTATAGVSRDADYTYAGILPDVFNDANFLLYDNGDSSKNLAFQLSGITTGTTRTLTVPDASGTIALTSDIPAGLADGDKGDITVSGTGATWTIDAGVVETSNLGGDITTAGKALLDDADAAAQRTTLGAAASGSITTSGLTQATARILGRTTASTGAVEEITVGSGLSLSAGELSSTVSAGIPATLLDAKGDLIVASAADTAARLAVGGTNGHVLTVDSNETLGVKWAAAAGGVGGGTGSTDNSILRSDGTGGSTLQDSALVIDDATTSTQANVALRNVHSETNSALVLCNKGTGAFIVSPARPDGTATGGSARGAESVCIVPSRDNANQVASGIQSVAIGRRARAAGGPSLAVGNASAAVGNGSCALGPSCNASVNDSFAAGNSASCTGGGGVAIGWVASATANNAVAIGGLNNTASLRGQFSVPPFSAVYWGGQTANATATILNLDATATNRFTIAASTALAVDILLVARRSDTADKWLVARRFLGIRRDGSNNTALIGSVQTLDTDQSEGSPSWTFTLSADDTNEALQLEVQGAASETVQWRATAFYRVV